MMPEVDNFKPRKYDKIIVPYDTMTLLGEGQFLVIGMKLKSTLGLVWELILSPYRPELEVPRNTTDDHKFTDVLIEDTDIVYGDDDIPDIYK